MSDIIPGCRERTNVIDDELKKIPELKVFKKKLKEHFLNS